MLASPKNRYRLKSSSHQSWRDETPLGFADGPNKYRYAGNDPINYRDPTGLRAAGHPLQTLRQVVSRVATSAFRTFNPLLSATIDAGVGLGASLINSRPTGLRASNSMVATRRMASEAPQLVRELVPGVPIVPRQARDLPGVRAALENPQRFFITDHGGQGNFVLDTDDGSVRFVTGEEVQPIETQQFLSRKAAQNAATRAQLLSLTQEGLISVSPFHETRRDLEIMLFGRNPYEPREQFSGQDKLAAFVFSTLPGANSKQVHFADEVLDGFQQVRLFDLPAFKRGQLAELEPRLLPEGRQGLPFNYAVIDAPPGISVTTIDLSKKTYQTGAGLTNRVNSKASPLVNLRTKDKVLRIGIPDDVPMTGIQSKALDLLKETLRRQGVELEVIPIN